jgi:hypothetical protein
MPLKDPGKGAFIPAAHELPEQLPIARLITPSVAGEVADIPQNIRSMFYPRHSSVPMKDGCRGDLDTLFRENEAVVEKGACPQGYSGQKAQAPGCHQPKAER